VGYISDILSGKAIDEEAKRLAAQFIKRLPKERTGDSKRLTAETSILMGHALGYQRQARLGMIGKSRLANTFQWALVEEGYDQAVAKELGQKIARTLAADKGEVKPTAKPVVKPDARAEK